MFRTPDFRSTTAGESYELSDPGTRLNELEQDTTIDKSREERIATRDAADLARLGKRQVLKRNFTFLPILSFACTVIITWEATFFTLELCLPNGGPAGAIYSFVLVWAGMLCVFTTIGEMTSIAPTSGGQYYWVAMLAPKSYRKFLSYITGWITLIGWQAVTASTLYICATLIQGLTVLAHSTSSPTLWQGVLLVWAMVAFSVFFNTILGNLLPHVEALGMILHVVGFFAILVPMIYLSNHADAKVIFTTFGNEGGWPTQGLAFMTILNGAVFDFLGSDSVIHMAEETRNAAKVSPKSMFISITFNGVLGLAALIATTLCADDLDAALNSPIGIPFIAIFLQTTQSVAGSMIMSVILLLMQVFAAIGIMAATSRMLWAFARDRGVPGWRTLIKVDGKNHIPMNAIGVTVAISCLLALLNLAGPIVFNDIVSLTVSSLLLSYFIVCALLLWRRCTRYMSYNTPVSQQIIIGDENSVPELNWGPWHLRGAVGTFINFMSCAFLAVTVFFSFWPPEVNPTPQTMNMSVLMFGATTLFAVIWYVIRGRMTYEGLIIELELDG
ncbi:choline transport protein [Mollisia scopiformis]|uniref:Choline transport protein n=1 Tax=Mollisia scopiformis TaxID=149040 RepID=A0A194WZN7_MOLSC|nr:choline transport protein [Mollisia scopiformis]KUJ13411.1 choline transport protein [Mollisia scopiformis]